MCFGKLVSINTSYSCAVLAILSNSNHVILFTVKRNVRIIYKLVYVFCDSRYCAAELACIRPVRGRDNL